MILQRMGYVLPSFDKLVAESAKHRASIPAVTGPSSFNGTSVPPVERKT